MSNPIDQLCCQNLSAIFSFCIGDLELERLGLLGPQSPDGPAVRLRALMWLRRVCREQPTVARNLTDILDLEFADTVLLVRELGEEGADRIVELWVERPDGRALPGLVWALSTDARESVRKAGMRLAMTATWLGCRELVEAPRTSDTDESLSAA